MVFQWHKNIKLLLHILVVTAFICTNCVDLQAVESVRDNTLSPPSHLKDVPEHIQEEFVLQFALKYFAEKIFSSSSRLNFQEEPRRNIDKTFKESEDYINAYAKRFGVPSYVKYLGYANLPDEVFVAIRDKKESIIIGFNKNTREQRLYTVEELIKLIEDCLEREKLEEASQLLFLLKRIPSVKSIILLAPERLAILSVIIPIIQNIEIPRFDRMLLDEFILYLNSLAERLEYAEALIDNLFISNEGCKKIRRSIIRISNCVRDILMELSKREDERNPDRLLELFYNFYDFLERISAESLTRDVADSTSLDPEVALSRFNSAHVRHLPGSTREPFLNLQHAVINQWLGLNPANLTNLEKLGLLILYEDTDRRFTARVKDIGNVFDGLEVPGIRIDRDTGNNTLQADFGEAQEHYIPKLGKTKTDILDVAKAMENCLTSNGYSGIKREMTNAQGVFAGNERHLGLVMKEVLDNSLHYASPEDITVSVETSQIDGNKIAVIKVRNPVSGDVVIPKEPFKPGVSTQGTPHWGIGLSLVKTIVDMWGGSVSLERDGGYAVCQINIPILALNRGKDKEASFANLRTLISGIISDERQGPQAERELQKLIVEFLFEVDIGEEDPIAFLDQHLPAYIKNVDDYPRIDEIRRVYGLIVKSSVNENRYGRRFWSAQLLLYTSLETILGRIIRLSGPTSNPVTGLESILAELYLSLGKCWERLNNHKAKLEYYKKARVFYETYRGCEVGVLISHSLSYEARLQALERILQKKPEGYRETEFIAGGIEMEVRFYLDRHSINFEKLPGEMLEAIETRINFNLKETIPNCPFRIQMDRNGWEIISQLIIVNKGDERKLPGILMAIQDSMLSMGIPFIRTELARIIREDGEVQSRLRETQGEWIDDYFNSIDESLTCLPVGFHFNKSEEEKASDKNLQGLPGLMGLVFLNNYMPIVDEQRYKAIRGLDSACPLTGSEDNYRPGRNEILVPFPFSHRRLPDRNPIYLYPTRDILGYLDAEEIDGIIGKIEGTSIDKKHDIIRRLEEFKRGNIKDKYIDLRETYLSFVLAVLAWYQKSDIGEGHEYENTQLPVLGFSLEQVNACIREMRSHDKSNRWDRPLKSLRNKSFRELLSVIVEDNNFIFEYLSNYGSAEQYLYLVSLSTPGGPNIRKIMEETESDTYTIPPLTDLDRDLDMYVFGPESDTRGYRLYPAEKSPRIIHFANNGRLYNLSAVNTKGHTVTNFVLEIPRDISGEENGKIVLSLREKERILRARRIVREGLEFSNLDSIRGFIETGETSVRSHRFPRIINGKDFYRAFKDALNSAGVSPDEADRILREGLKRRTGDGAIVEEPGHIKEIAGKTLSTIIGREITMFALDQILDFHEEAHGIIGREDAEAVKQKIIERIHQEQYELLKTYFQNLYGEYADEMELIEELIVTMFTEEILGNPVRLLKDINNPESRIDLNQMGVSNMDICSGIKGYRQKEIELKTKVIKGNLDKGRENSSAGVAVEYKIWKARQSDAQKIIDALSPEELELYADALSIWDTRPEHLGIHGQGVRREFDELCHKHPSLNLMDDHLIRWLTGWRNDGVQFIRDAAEKRRQQQAGKALEPRRVTARELTNRLATLVGAGAKPEDIIDELGKYSEALTRPERTMSREDLRRNPLVMALNHRMRELISFYKVSRSDKEKPISGEISYGREEDSVSMLFAIDAEKLKNMSLELMHSYYADVNLGIKVSFHGDMAEVTLIYKFPKMERAVSLGAVYIRKPLTEWNNDDETGPIVDRLTFFLRQGIRDMHELFSWKLHMKFRYDLYEALKAELSRLAESTAGGFDPEALAKSEYWIEQGFSTYDSYYISDIYYTAFRRNIWHFFLIKCMQEYDGWRNNDNFRWMYILFMKDWFGHLLKYFHKAEETRTEEGTIGQYLQELASRSSTGEIDFPFDNIFLYPPILKNVSCLYSNALFVRSYFSYSLLDELLKYSNEDVSRLVSRFPDLLEGLIKKIRNSEPNTPSTDIEKCLDRKLREFKALAEKQGYPDLFDNLLNLFMNSIIEARYMAEIHGYRFRNSADTLRFIKALYTKEEGMITKEEDSIEDLLSKFAERVPGATAYSRGSAESDSARARDILGLGNIPNPTPDDIKRAYRKLAIQYHPDHAIHRIAEEARKRGLDEKNASAFIKEEMANASNKFKDIHWAYEVLTNRNGRTDSTWIYKKSPKTKLTPLQRQYLEESAKDYLVTAGEEDRIIRLKGPGVNSANISSPDLIRALEYINSFSITESDGIAIAAVIPDEEEPELIGFSHINSFLSDNFVAVTAVGGRHTYEGAGDNPYTIYLRLDDIIAYIELGEEGRTAFGKKLMHECSDAKRTLRGEDTRHLDEPGDIARIIDALENRILSTRGYFGMVTSEDGRRFVRTCEVTLTAGIDLTLDLLRLDYGFLIQSLRRETPKNPIITRATISALGLFLAREKLSNSEYISIVNLFSNILSHREDLVEYTAGLCKTIIDSHWDNRLVYDGAAGILLIIARRYSGYRSDIKLFFMQHEQVLGVDCMIKIQSLDKTNPHGVNQEYMNVPNDMRAEHGLLDGMDEDGFYLGDETGTRITGRDISMWRDAEEGFTLVDIGSGRSFKVSNKILETIPVESLKPLLLNALGCEDLRSLSFGDGPIIINTCKRSKRLFGDCVGNRLILINDAFLKLYGQMKTLEMEKDAKGLLQLGLEHELLHELKQKGREIEAELLNRDLKRITTLFGIRLLNIAVYLINQGVVESGLLNPAQMNRVVLSGDFSEPVLFEGRNNKRVTIPPSAIRRLKQMADLSRELDVELPSELEIVNGVVNRVFFPDERSKIAIVKTTTEDEDDNDLFYTAGEYILRFAKHHTERQTISDFSIDLALSKIPKPYYPNAREFDTNKISFRIFSVSQGEYYEIRPQELVRRLHAGDEDTIRDILNIEYIATKWWSSDFNFRGSGFFAEGRKDFGKPGIEWIELHRHPNGVPSPPSAWPDGRGDIYSGGFMEGRLNGLILDDNGTDVLFLFYEPDETRKQEYIEMFEKYWDSNESVLGDLEQIAMQPHTLKAFPWDSINNIAQTISEKNTQDLILNLDEDGTVQIRGTKDDALILSLDAQHWDIFSACIRGRKDTILEFIPQGAGLQEIRDLLYQILLRKELISQDRALAEDNLARLEGAASNIKQKKRITISSRFLVDNVVRKAEGRFEYNQTSSGIKYLISRVRQGYDFEIINESGLSDSDLDALLKAIFDIKNFNIVSIEDARSRERYTNGILLLHEESNSQLLGLKDQGVKTIIGKKGLSLNVLVTVGIYKLLNLENENMKEVLLSLGYDENTAQEIIQEGIIILPPVTSLAQLINDIASIRRVTDTSA